ncbi:uncharacterized protein LOC112889756 isoform X2 [Panicum hallii]|uniref:uncharacterized protein LOC112889756 isoform X2 n=1 Tax=Panicum hallii TaxID=206008 RepID=UPI000DF4DBB4|nr:uncharacterized protein LOC112889756 isoform X2 [Panicum hallii]
MQPRTTGGLHLSIFWTKMGKQNLDMLLDILPNQDNAFRRAYMACLAPRHKLVAWWLWWRDIQGVACYGVEPNTQTLIGSIEATKWKFLLQCWLPDPGYQTVNSDI